MKAPYAMLILAALSVSAQTKKPVHKPAALPYGRELVADCPNGMSFFYVSRDSTVEVSPGHCKFTSPGPVCVFVNGKLYVQRKSGDGYCIGGKQ